MKFYRTYREWDAYADCYGDIVTYQLGLIFRNCFIGIEWWKYQPK